MAAAFEALANHVRDIVKPPPANVVTLKRRARVRITA
jgi:hypothetical protein